MKFDDLQLKQPLLDALRKAEYTEPTPIQEKAIPVALSGRDLIACAQTGTGKTAAFALPILNNLGEHDPSHIRALVLTPTRELAIQNFDCFKRYGRYLTLRAACIYGGAKQAQQEAQLKKGCDILIATPGRLLDFMGQGLVSLEDVEIFVLDEADRMLDMGFIGDVRKIASHMEDRKQTLLFSATMPREIEALAGELLYNPVSIKVDPDMRPAETVDQHLVFVKKQDKRTCLEKMLRSIDVEKAIIFVRTKHGADRLKKQLVRDGFGCVVIHGDRTQGQRQNALEQFRSGAVDILVATDVAARGLDIPDVSHVFNMDLPQEPENYIHRIGRTGRAGKGGVSVTFCDEEELELLRDVEKLIGREIPVMETEFSVPLERLKPAGSPPKSGTSSGKKSGRKDAKQQGKEKDRRKTGRDSAKDKAPERAKSAVPARGKKEEAPGNASKKASGGSRTGKSSGQEETAPLSGIHWRSHTFTGTKYQGDFLRTPSAGISSSGIHAEGLSELTEPRSSHDKRKYAPKLDDSRSWEHEDEHDRHGDRNRRSGRGHSLRKGQQHAGGARKRRPN